MKFTSTRHPVNVVCLHTYQIGTYRPYIQKNYQIRNECLFTWKLRELCFDY